MNKKLLITGVLVIIAVVVFAFLPKPDNSLTPAVSNLNGEKGIQFFEPNLAKALQEAKLELANIKIDGANITDSIALSLVLNNMVQKELAKIDWTKVNSDLQKARLDLVSISANAENEDQEQKINESLQLVNQQLKAFNDKKSAFDAAGLLKSLFEKKKKDIIKPQLQLKSKEEKEKNKQLTSIVRTRKPLKVWSDMERDDYSFGVTKDAIAGITGNTNRIESTGTHFYPYDVQ